MKRILLLLFFLLLSNGVMSQKNDSIIIEGKVESDENIESVHVINKTAQKFTTTNSLGEFTIAAKLNDTLLISSVQHKLESIVVDGLILLERKLHIKLETQITSLDQVVVGKILTGDILSDIGNVEDAPMTSKQAGIPSYQGKLKTQSERRLSEASTGGILSLNPILNGISGRTKKLKQRVKLEEKNDLIYSIKARLADDFFASNPLDEDLRMDFFFFCADDQNFILHCKNKNDFKILLFLRHKYRAYKENLKLKTD